jgi:hypothetical protein
MALFMNDFTKLNVALVKTYNVRPLSELKVNGIEKP